DAQGAGAAGAGCFAPGIARAGGWRVEVSRASRDRLRAGVAFSSPLIFGLATLTLYPILSSFYFSFTDYPTISPPGAPSRIWVGPANFNELAHDPRFWLSVWNTFYFVL